MARLVVVCLVLLTVGLAPASGWAQAGAVGASRAGAGGGMRPAFPPGGPPPPPTVISIIPSPPALVYIPTPRVEPAPEIAGPKGTWARHGNGKEYPYTWVFQPTHSTR